MQIVDLIRGNRRSPEQRQSYVSKDAVLRRARSPVLALHQTVVGGGAAKDDSVAMVVSAHSDERTAPCDAALEMVDV